MQGHMGILDSSVADLLVILKPYHFCIELSLQDLICDTSVQQRIFIINNMQADFMDVISEP